VEGPADSLSVLVDELAARLLSLEAGVDTSRLSSLTTTSLPAIRAYLAGRAAFRKGHLDEALRRFREATFLDSTFALAALELVNVSAWYTGRGGEDPERGARLAFAGRERLGPADRALLDNWAGPLPTGPELFQRWQAAASAYPDRAETWYGLGDAYFHYGVLVGLEDPPRLAAEAFKRGWAIDSLSGADSLVPERSPIWAEPLVHMVEIAQGNGDAAAVRRLVAQGLAADSTSREGWYLRWHRAVALGDSARRAFWADSLRIDSRAFGMIFAFISSAGVTTQDYVRSAQLYAQASYPDAAALQHGVVALNGGRPREALLALGGLDDTSRPAFRSRIHEALYWGADMGGAAEAARRLAPYAAGTAVRGEAAVRQLESLCVVATWRAARGDYRYSEAAIRRLRGVRVSGPLPHDSPIAVTQYTALCAALLEADRATALRLREARSKLEDADAAARTFIYMPSLATLAANLVVARVAEAQGDLPLALRAVRRRAGGYGLTPRLRGGWYLSTFLREEGRLATLTGDTAGAVRAYRHYLALRTNPEPAMAPEVASVRAQLERLVPQAAVRTHE
jgi:tetratricopeptide (TPR) repeat protein